MDHPTQLRFLLDVFIAIVLGGLLGLEREKHDKPAGFRTHMLISGISALLLIIGRYIALDMQNYLNREGFGVDPIRIIQAIIVGISFIGAGTIIKSPEDKSIKYLTTAATILISSGVGMCVGLRLYVLAVGITLLGLMVNWLVKAIFE